jgi:outer membrane lipoprotein carrier protein LolA
MMMRLDRRRACVATAALAVAMPAWAAFGFDELMTTLAQRRSGEARFAEQRFVSGLDQTLNYTGTLSFTAPDRLARNTLTPRPESFVVEGNQLTLQRGDRVRRVALDSVPELAAMVAAMRGTLSGDGTVLQRYFRPTVQGAAARWTLTLEPLDFRLLSVVRLLRIDGFRADVRLVELQLADGDRSVMTIEPIAPTPARPATP